MPAGSKEVVLSGATGPTSSLGSQVPEPPPRTLKANPSIASNYQPSNLAETMIFWWVTQMGPDIEIDFLNAMRRFATIVPDGVATRWSLFAGSGVGTRIYEALEVVLQSHLGIQVAFDSCLCAEHKEEKQAHLIDQFSPRFLISEVGHLRGPSAKNLARGGAVELLPYCFILDGGPPCTSRTPLSSRRSSNLNCVQEAREATGVGFSDVLAVTKEHWPQMISLECVKELNQESGDQAAQSDSDWVISQLRSAGYWAHTDTMDAVEFGSYPARVRTYWSGLMNLKGKPQDISHFFNRVLVACKSAGDESNIWDWIDTDDEVRAASSAKSGIPLHSSFGLYRKSKTLKEDQQWKHEHMVLFHLNGLAWPFEYDDLPVGNAVVEIGGMFPREVEATVFLHLVFPFDESNTFEFIDINQTLPRHVKRHLDEDTSRPKEPATTPWRPRPPTLVGSGKLLVRYKNPEQVLTVRLVECFETMRMVGWDDSMWKIGRCVSQDETYPELISNMAGNAYSLFHFGPWMLASIATFGRFWDPELASGTRVAGDSDNEGCVVESSYSETSPFF